jgi:hypothetical protein
MNYTLNNHLYYTIGGRKFGYRQSGTEKYEVFAGQIDKDQYRKSSWREELTRTADTVLNEYGKDLIVFLSGGTDSEIVLRNFIEIGFKPRCAVIKFADDYNFLDVKEAINISKELDVKLDVINFDVKNFYHSGLAEEFSKQIDCTQITYLMVYYHVKTLGFPAVMGGEQLLRKSVSAKGASWYHCFRENEDASAMRFSEKFKIPLVNEWFSYTPEMMLFYLEDFMVQDLILNSNFKISSVSSKNAILTDLFPEVRQKIKTHGFERLLGFNGEVYNKLKKNMVRRLVPSLDGIEISKLIAQLKGQHD